MLVCISSRWRNVVKIAVKDGQIIFPAEVTVVLANTRDVNRQILGAACIILRVVSTRLISLVNCGPLKVPWVGPGGA